MAEQIDVQPETKHSKVIVANTFSFRLNENKEESWTRIAQNVDKRQKLRTNIGNTIQKSMKKKGKEIVTGDIWEEDFHAIFDKVLTLIKFNE